MFFGEEIKNFDAKIFINKDGAVDIKKTIVYDFDSLQRHGIYRIISYVKKIRMEKI